MSHWPAITKWKDLDYLLKFADWRALFGSWMEARAHDHRGAPRTQPCIGWHICNPALSRIACPLRPGWRIPELRQDIRIRDYCAVGGGDMKSANAWFGPAGTVTPLRKDPHHNLFTQVLGQKYVRLYSPQLSEQLYPFGEFMLCNSSQVDLDNPDYQKHPEILKLSCMDYILEEGDMLYIPQTWWHYIRSLSRSFSVSFWWAVSIY